MGGGEISLYYLLKWLDRRRFTPLVVVNESGPLVQLLEKLGIRVLYVPFHRTVIPRLLLPWMFWRNFRASLLLRQIVKQNNVEIIHCTDLFTLILLTPFLCRHRVPVVYHAIIFYHWSQRLLLKLFATTLIRRAVANSHAVKQSLMRPPTMRTPIAVLHGGVDRNRFRPFTQKERLQARALRKIPPHTKVIGLVARYDVWKGHTTFLHALCRLREVRSDFLAVLVGGALTSAFIPRVQRYYKQIQDLIQKLSLSDVVQDWGHVEDIESVYPILDTMVCPSDREPFGLVLLEGYACGIPIVTTRYVGALEILADRRFLFICEPNDPNALAREISNALHSQRQKPRESQLRQLSWQGYAREFQSQYELALDEIHSNKAIGPD